MKSRQDGIRWIRLCLLFPVGAAVLSPVGGFAAERQFLVTLADSPKDARVPCGEDADCRALGSEFACGDAGIGRNVCVVPCTSDADCEELTPPDLACHSFLRICDDALPSPELIRRQYFDKTDPNIDSFAEFWQEISYGDVTVAGRVSDWILLPWPLSVPFTWVELQSAVPSYRYGGGESFDNSRTMVAIDTGQGPPSFTIGAGRQVTSRGQQVWTPGERFRDINGDGVWNGGFDEARNAMDWRDNEIPTRPHDDLPDLAGPWIDLNGNGIPENEGNCIYLPDSDNDGTLDLDDDGDPDDRPDCCPNGPGEPGCRGLVSNQPDPPDKACPPTTWTDADGITITDCNGNLIDDAFDLLLNPNLDRLPYGEGDLGQCEPLGDGILDACQFAELDGSGNLVYPSTPCSATAPNCEGEDPPPCCNIAPTACLRAPRNPAPRCEFFDANGNGVLDVPEPWENYFRGSNIPEYIRHNFPGTNPDAVIARSHGRQIGGPHDPLGKLTNSRDKVCWDERPYRPIGSQSEVCPAGTHDVYDPPDAWSDLTSPDPSDPLLFGSSKMMIGGSSTPKPDWYESAWRDRYNNATPPTWVGSTSASFFDPRNPIWNPLLEDGPNEFRPNRGGLNGNGVGWPADIDPEAPVLPDQMLGAAPAPVIYYDGPVEHDDLPSSKYHLDGDQYVGEVTSPFSYSIAGDDRGTNNPSVPGNPDGIIPAAGPYATRLHGQNGRDGGNQLAIEALTWRTALPANNGDVWQDRYGSHPYAGPPHNLGFRDYNLDGRLDLGEARVSGSESYQGIFGVALSDLRRADGTGDRAWDDPRTVADPRSRVIEDCIEILDETLDFDTLVDQVVLDALACYPRPVDIFDDGTPTVDIRSTKLPEPYTNDGPVSIAGTLAGVVLIPSGHAGFPLVEPMFRPVHNEDGLGDMAYQDSDFPSDNPLASRINWNLRFHNLVHTLGSGSENDVSSSADFATTFCAHEYGHAWQNWPDLYDYDALDRSGVENCPIGAWDLMATGGLAHPIGPLKEAECTEWTKPVDLTSLLTPGVDKSITLPVAEFVRDDSYFYLENEDRPRERIYFWSAGAGFDERMPGPGLLILHADPDTNPSNRDAIALQQRSGLRPAYRIIQADGLRELEGGPGVDLACGDAGDPWPGSTDQTTFDCNTLPASQWYTDEACTGLEIRDVIPDGEGATRVVFNWTPTSIPSLRFIDPPGGVSVSGKYQIRTEANDVFGGTLIRFYYKKHDNGVPDFSGSTFISQIRKTTSGPNDISIDWTVSSLADGRYFIFADLIPGPGADGTEAKLTRPRAGRNNLGTAKLETTDVIVNVTTVSGTTVTNQGTARSETWVAECVDPTNGKWVVSSSITQPLPEGGADIAICTATPDLCATAGTQYTSRNSAVKMTIRTGGTNDPSPKGALGDTFTLVTTGITAASEAVTIRGGQVREDPTAVIDATPLSGPPPLKVTFDARGSSDPNGQPLQYRWTFGDGSAQVTGAQVEHTYSRAGTFTVVLRATNPANNRFGEASVDIAVTNNSPNAVIRATPTSGGTTCPGSSDTNARCLTVDFSAEQSSDQETPEDDLIFQWTFGDGTSANDDAQPGILEEVEHTYSRRADGTACTTASPCSFTATLKVTDSDGGTDTASIIIRVGNSNPQANITTTALVGLSPHTVTFNASKSTDPENDAIEVEWIWGDGTPNEIYKAKTGKPPATNGDVPHTFTLPANETIKSYTVKAILRDLDAAGARKGGETTWPGVIVTVQSDEGEPGQNRPPRASFTVTPAEPLVGEVVTFDASASTDPDGDALRYRWSFGDGDVTTFGTASRITHTYDATGTYTVRLTVRDAEDASIDVTQTVQVVPVGTNRAPVAMIATGPRSGSAPLTLTFDGRISFDPDGDPLAYAWEFRQGETVLETLTGSVVTRIFQDEGEFTVTLVVADGRGGRSSSEPETVIVSGRVEPPPPEPPPPQDVPEEPPPSEAQRPTTMCGIGMLGTFLACVLGLRFMAAVRRRS